MMSTYCYLTCLSCVIMQYSMVNIFSIRMVDDNAWGWIPEIFINNSYLNLVGPINGKAPNT